MKTEQHMQNPCGPFYIKGFWCKEYVLLHRLTTAKYFVMNVNSFRNYRLYKEWNVIAAGRMHILNSLLLRLSSFS